MGVLDRLTGGDRLREENERLRRELRNHRRAIPGVKTARETSILTDADRRRVISRFKEVVKALHAQADLDATLRFIVATILEITSGERAFLVLRQAGALRFCVALDRAGAELPEAKFEVSRTIADTVARTGEPIVSGLATEDEQLRGIDSVKKLGVVSVLCLPLHDEGAAIGSVYVDDRRQEQAFSGVDLPLAQAFVDLASVAIGRLRADESRRRAERVASLGLAVNYVFHDLASPMQVIRYRSELLERRLREDDEKAGAMLRSIGEQCDRIDSMIREVLEWSRGEPRLHRRKVAVSAIVEPLAETFDEPLRRAEVTLDFDLGWDGVIDVDPGRIRRALENLIRNAIRAVPRGGRVTVRSRRQGDFARLSVSDDGPGLDPADRDRVFEAFFTGTDVGSGVGLTMVKQTIEAHGGTVEALDAAEGGAELVIRLPIEGASS